MSDMINKPCFHSMLVEDCLSCWEGALWRCNEENIKLRALIKLLCSAPDGSIFGGEAFQRIRDSVNPQSRELLLTVLSRRD